MNFEDTKSNRCLTALRVDPEHAGIFNNDIIEKLAKENIETRRVWKPMHLQPLFDGVKYYAHEKANSVSDKLFQYGLCLSSGLNMSVEEGRRVIDLILDLFAE